MALRVLFIVFMGILAGCDSPSVAFMGAQKTVVVIEESTFAVHWRDGLAEVYRTSFEMLPDRARVLRNAELAIVQATGCKVRTGSLKGDQALIKARLACSGDAAAPLPIAANLHYECDIVDTWDFETRDVTVEAIDCALVPGSAR